MRNFLLTAFALTLFLCLGSSCGKDDGFGISGDGGIEVSTGGRRLPSDVTRRVLLFYECGHNSLYRDLRSDVNNELNQGFIPTEQRSGNVLLVFSKLSETSAYKPVKSYLRRLYLNHASELVSDTLKVFDESTVAASAQTMREVLSFVREKFPAKSYGMVFSSHGTGWLPAGYYNDPGQFEREHSKYRSGAVPFSSLDIPEGDIRTTDPYAHLVRSIGNEKVVSSEDYEMSLDEFVSGIPFHLDYLLFDMCLTGGIEVVYALRNCADHIGVSVAEVLSDGMFDYTKISSFLIGSEKPDLEGLFEDSFNKYDSKTDKVLRSSTVNLVRTDGVERLASVCKVLIEKYRAEIANAPVSRIQGYFRMNRHYFYDLVDVFVQCGASEEDLALLRDAVDRCVVYRNATPSFMNSFDIRTYSGFSIYLPCYGTPLLDSYYREEAWNKAVELVR